MPPTDARHASPRAVLRKTPPQGLRLRRFKRAVALVRLSGPGGTVAQTLALRKGLGR